MNEERKETSSKARQRHSFELGGARAVSGEGTPVAPQLVCGRAAATMSSRPPVTPPQCLPINQPGRDNSEGGPLFSHLLH